MSGGNIPPRDAKEFWATWASGFVVPLKTEDLFRDYWTRRYLTQLKYLKNGERVLDVGCGNAKYFVKMKGKFRELYGIDLTEVPFEAARKIFPAGNYVVGDEGRLPFRDDSFDAIISWGAFEHNDYIDSTIRECHRVLAPGGVLLFSVPNYFSSAFPYIYIYRILKKQGRVASIGNHYSNRFLRTELEKIGFSQVKFVDSIYAAPLPILALSFWPFVRAAKLILKKPQMNGEKGTQQYKLSGNRLSRLNNFRNALNYYYAKAFYPLERLGLGLVRVIQCHK